MGKLTLSDDEDHQPDQPLRTRTPVDTNQNKPNQFLTTNKIDMQHCAIAIPPRQKVVISTPSHNPTPEPQTVLVPSFVGTTSFQSGQSSERFVQKFMSISLQPSCHPMPVFPPSPSNQRVLACVSKQEPSETKALAEQEKYHLRQQEIRNEERMKNEQKRKHEHQMRLEEERKRKQEEERKQKEDEERKRKQEEERKRRQEEERKRRQEEEQKRKEEEDEKIRKEEDIKREEDEKQRVETRRREEEDKQLHQKVAKQDIAVRVNTIAAPGSSIPGSVPQDAKAVSIVEWRGHSYSTRAAWKMYDQVMLIRKGLDEKRSEFKETSRFASLSLQHKDIRRRINMRANQISNDVEQISVIKDDFAALLDAKQIDEGMLIECVFLIAEKFVDQAEEGQMRSNEESAFSYSGVVFALSPVAPDLPVIVLSEIFIRCPFACPRFFLQKNPNGQVLGDDEFLKMQGYVTRGVNGQSGWEPRDQYMSRMMSILRFYVTMLLTPPPNGVHLRLGSDRAVGLPCTWSWVAFVLNLSTSSSAAACLVEFLKVAGSSMLQVYRGQFNKILECISTKFMPKMHERLTKAGASMEDYSRLSTIMTGYAKSKSIPPHAGQPVLEQLGFGLPRQQSTHQYRF